MEKETKEYLEGFITPNMTDPEKGKKTVVDAWNEYFLRFDISPSRELKEIKSTITACLYSGIVTIMPMKLPEDSQKMKILDGPRVWVDAVEKEKKASECEAMFLRLAPETCKTVAGLCVEADRIKGGVQNSSEKRGCYSGERKMRMYNAWERGFEAEYTVPVIAESSKEAKLIAFKEIREMGGDSEFIDIRVRWMKGVNIDGLSSGVCDDGVELIRRGIFTHMSEGETCDKCHDEDCSVHSHKGKALCIECLEVENTEHTSNEVER